MFKWLHLQYEIFLEKIFYLCIMFVYIFNFIGFLYDFINVSYQTIVSVLAILVMFIMRTLSYVWLPALGSMYLWSPTNLRCFVQHFFNKYPVHLLPNIQMQISGSIRRNAKQTLHEKNKLQNNFLIKHNLRNLYQFLVVNWDISFWFENDLTQQTPWSFATVDIQSSCVSMETTAAAVLKTIINRTGEKG